MRIFYKFLGLIYRISFKLKLIIWIFISSKITVFFFKLNNSIIGKNLKSVGIPIIHVKLNSGKILIGNYFKINNGRMVNIIGREQKCSFIVKGKLEIGDNVGLSATTIVCWLNIKIGNNVRIGGNTVIYDTDFHSLNTNERSKIKENKSYIKCIPVIIKNNAFIGAHSTILKGVTIGENSVIGACSVVTKSIPDNEIWAGNPIRFIRRIDEN